jgi:hypothetical protein
MEKVSKQASKQASCMVDLCNVFVCRAVASLICFFVYLTLLRCDQIVCRSELSHITLYGTAVFGCTRCDKKEINRITREPGVGWERQTDGQ